MKPLILKRNSFDNAIPYLDISVLESGMVKEYTYKELAVVSNENDVLVVWDGSRSGLVFKGIPGAIGSTIMGLTPIGLDSEYLYYFLKAQFEFINGNTTGAGIPHVNSDVFFEIKVPYYSIEQQRKIILDLNNKKNANSFFYKNSERLFLKHLHQQISFSMKMKI